MTDTSGIRQLIPKSFHFDGYNELNCTNSRDKPFFGDNTVQMGDYVLTTSLKDPEHLSIRFQAVCPDQHPKIFFASYTLSLDYYLAKLQDALEKDCDFITFDIIPFYNGILRCDKCDHKTNHCSQLLNRCPNTIKAAVSFDRRDIERAFSIYHGIIKGGNTMSMHNSKKKGLFGGMLNCEMGRCTDPHIKSTMMGISVCNPANGNWYIFDPATGTRKNMANMKFGNFPIILLPVKDLTVGDLIKYDKTYYYVKEVGHGPTIKLIGAADGKVNEIYPEESFIPGFTLYSKVFACDMKTFTDTSSNKGLGSNILAAFFFMQWANGGDKAEFSLDNISNDSFNGLGEFLPLLLASKNNFLGAEFSTPDGTLNLPLLLALGNGSGDDNQGMQMLVMSQLLGGGNNPFAALTQPTTAGANSNGAQVVCSNPKCGKHFDSAEKKYCSDCGAPTIPVVNTTDAKLICTNPECTEKGKVYENAKFCPQCGKPLSPVGPTACRKCGEPLRENAKFCTKCGTKVVPDTCPQCGAHYDEGAAFCSQCGHSLKAPSTPTAPVTPSEPNPEAAPVAT